MTISASSIGPSEEEWDGAGYFRSEVDRFELFIKDVARYTVENASRVEVRFYPDSDPQKVRLFLLGSVMGALLYQRHLLPLHASAVQTELGVMAFVGAQGEGKSTLAAHLYRRGYPVIADDVCVVSPDGAHGYRAEASLPQLRLCDDALDDLSRHSDFAISSFEVDKHVVTLPHSVKTKLSRLAAIYVLESAELGPVQVLPVQGFDRFNLLLANLYRIEYLRGLDAYQPVMQFVLDMATRVPIYRLRRPRDLERIDESIKALENHWNASIPAKNCQGAS